MLRLFFRKGSCVLCVEKKISPKVDIYRNVVVYADMNTSLEGSCHIVVL